MFRIGRGRGFKFLLVQRFCARNVYIDVRGVLIEGIFGCLALGHVKNPLDRRHSFALREIDLLLSVCTVYEQFQVLFQRLVFIFQVVAHIKFYSCRQVAFIRIDRHQLYISIYVCRALITDVRNRGLCLNALFAKQRQRVNHRSNENCQYDNRNDYFFCGNTVRGRHKKILSFASAVGINEKRIPFILPQVL